MKKIKEVIVVEGKTDTSKLRNIFDVDTIETNGSDINNKTINLIKKVNETRGVILFLDPDYQGEKIRKQILEKLPECKQAFLINKITNKKKNGIAEASREDILKSLENIIQLKENESITQSEFRTLNLEGNSDSKQKRISLCEKIGITYCNAKQLFKRVNMLNLSKEDIEKILGE